MENTTQVRYLTADERDLMTHISRFGSSGYPLIRTGKVWSWSYRESISSAENFPTKKAAIASFEAYHQSLIDQYALENIDPGFRAWLEGIAHLNSQRLFDVFLLWRKYCRDCQGFDQSPVMSEFLRRCGDDSHDYAGGRMSQSVEEAKSGTVYAAFNPETGEFMASTIRTSRQATEAERDRFYVGCPIHECWLSPLFPVEDINDIAKDWPS